SGSEINDTLAQNVLNNVTSAKAASPDTEIQAEFTTVDSDSLSVSADIVKQIAESDIPVVLKTQALDVEAPAELLQSIGNSGNLTVSGSVTTDVPEEMKKYIGDNTIVVDVSLSVNGQAWTQFGDSKIKVTLPYQLKAGENANSIRVVCLSGTAPEYFDATYDATTQTASFYTSHCSLFAVVPIPASPSSDGGMDMMLIVGIVIAIAAVAGVAAYFLVIKKKA
ncbi:MAG: hypothetical protein J5707_05525, partial [Candidatus Methanomethylophilus sp.]|nr:hypothetical protein [Methanomethylophilus sp.]